MELTAHREILIVEDEEKIANLLASHLRRASYEVHVETRGAAAVDYAAAHAPQLVILDLRLPDMHGYEVCKALRVLYNSWAVPVLMLTAMDQPIDQLHGLAHGADAYMTKPFELAEVLDTVAKLLNDPAPAL